MIVSKKDSYEDIDYPCQARPQAHPDRFATHALLFGLKSPPLEKCRVLEIGCADGGNLIPQACAFPESRFVGIDLTESAIASGQKRIASLGLTNIELKRMDITNLDPDFGKFDYILAHGFYSWVPTEVRDKLLEVCHSHLTPSGVAFVSYDTFPGGHIRRMVREVMLYHIRSLESPNERIEEAKALLQLMFEAQVENKAYRELFETELKGAVRNRGGFFHDALSQFNSPVYFHEFVEHAARHRLQFLAEAIFPEMYGLRFTPETHKTIEKIAGEDILAREQYLDFFCVRRFRQTLLCHEEVKLVRPVQLGQVQLLNIGSPVTPVSQPINLEPGIAQEFKDTTGPSVTTSNPLAKAALAQLGEVWPHPVPFGNLLALAWSRVAPTGAAKPGDDDIEGLAGFLLNCYAAGLAEFHVHIPGFVLKPGDRPVASPMARFQAKIGPEITNLRHESLRIDDPIARHVLTLLDGSRDRRALAQELSAFAATIPALDGTTPSAPVQISTENLASNLGGLARLALLIA